jgi:hypothetical protein
MFKTAILPDRQPALAAAGRIGGYTAEHGFDKASWRRINLAGCTGSDLAAIPAGG